MKRYLFEIHINGDDSTKVGFVDAPEKNDAQRRLVNKFGEHREIILDESKADRPEWGDDAIYYLSHDGFDFEIFETNEDPDDPFLVKFNHHEMGRYESLYSAIWHAERMDMDDDVIGE
jgi:hypothetical protein